MGRGLDLSTPCARATANFTWNDLEHWTELVRTVMMGMNDYDYDDLRPFLMLA